MSIVELEFENDRNITIEFAFIGDPHEFAVPRENSTFVKLTDFREVFPLEYNGVREIEVWGRDAE